MLQDVASSASALNQLQGTVLYSSPSREGMRLEYPFKMCYAFLLFLSLCSIVILMRNSDMQNHGWESGGSPGKITQQVKCTCFSWMHHGIHYNQGHDMNIGSMVAYLKDVDKLNQTFFC